MENVNTLDYLLQIEAKAAALVYDAQAEADRRIYESEEKNRKNYEEQLKIHTQLMETSSKKTLEKTKNEYQKALDDYRREISVINIDTENFIAIFNDYLEKL